MNVLNPIPNFIKKYIEYVDTVFVFPTQTAANMWADWTITNTSSTAVPMERFIAWDDFKGSSIRSTHQDKNSIPGTMRSIFSADLIQRNASEGFLSYIITKEYAKSASGFTDWISGVLPSLSLWKKNLDEKNIVADEEDNDYLEIYARYKAFLESHNLFDPAWETPPFDSRGKKFVIFFPEILMDYLEYKKILETTPDIELVHVPQIDGRPDGHFYSNSRTELRHLCLRLKKIHDERGIAWQDMAISVPDLETWGPYIDRELDLYEIPHVQKNGTPLTSSTAGNLFQQIQDCVSQNFSYDSIKNLLLNTSLPWSDFKLNQRLIKFGQENNCICSFDTLDNEGQIKGEYDVWENSFRNPINKNTTDERLTGLYRTLKSTLKAIVQSESFDDIRKNYFTFRTKFLDSDKFSDQSNRIISRCISELSELIDLEKDFPDCTVPSHYSFFVSFLGGKNYVPQTDENGVQILPYRLSAPAPFKIQAVIDSSQSSLSIIYRQLAFLNDEKRKLLGFTQESNVSEHFINLYNICSTDETIFTAAEKTFKGYSLTSAYLAEKDHRPGKHFIDDHLDEEDNYLKEKSSFLDSDKKLPEKLFLLEKKGFESWRLMQNINTDSRPTSAAIEKINNLIDENLLENGKVKITYSHLKYFYNDSHDFMRRYVLKLNEQNNVADLTPPFLIGILNHMVLEKFCKSLSESGLPLKIDSEDSLPDEYVDMLYKGIDEAIESIKSSSLSRQLIKTARQSLQAIMISAVTELSRQFNGYEILATEHPYTYEPENENFFFYGIVDCIIKEPSTGDCILVDFKTSDGAIPKKSFFVTEDCSIPDFQMPIYIHILENQKPSIQIENCTFFNIHKAEFSPVIGPLAGAKPDCTIEKTMECFLSLARFYAQKVIDHDIDSEDSIQSWLKSHLIELPPDSEKEE